MKYTVKETDELRSLAVVDITELEPDELYAHAVLQIRKELGVNTLDARFLSKDGELTFQPVWNELLKMGVSGEVVSKRCNLPIDEVEDIFAHQKDTTYSFEVLIGDVVDPVYYLAIQALEHALEPTRLVYSLVRNLSDSSAGLPQLTYASIAKYGDVDEARVKKFAESDIFSCFGIFTEIELYRLSVALLLVNQTLNWRSNKPVQIQFDPPLPPE